jgi:hypothetical protein
MKDDSEEKPLTTEDLIKIYEGLQKDYSDAVKASGKEKAGKILWMIVALFFMYVWLYGAKHHVIWVPDPNDQQIRVDYSDWWGIEKQTFYPVWRKPTGETSKDAESWCIKWPDGTWQAFLKDDMESVYYEWPGKGYSSPTKK